MTISPEIMAQIMGNRPDGPVKPPEGGNAPDNGGMDTTDGSYGN